MPASTLSNTDYALLGMLNLEPMSGYQIRKEIAESIAHFWTESFGQIYPALKRLTLLRLIKPVRQATSDNGRGQLFAITAKGKTELAQWLAMPPELQSPRNQLLLKLFFGRGAKPEITLVHLRQARDQTNERLQNYRQLQERLRHERRGHPDALFWLATARHGELMAAAHIDWCDESIAALSQPSRGQQPTKKHARAKTAKR